MALSGTGVSTGGWYAPLTLSTANNLPLSVSGWVRMPLVDPYSQDFGSQFGVSESDTTFFSLSSDDVNGYATLACAYSGGSLYVDVYDDAASAEGGVWAAWTPSQTWQHV